MDLAATMAGNVEGIIPQIKGSIFAGALVAFTMYSMTFHSVIYNRTWRFQYFDYVYSNVKRVNPTINALSTLIVIFATILLILTNVVPMIRERRNTKNEVNQ